MSLARKLEACVKQFLTNEGYQKPMHLNFVQSDKVKRPHLLIAASNGEEAIIKSGTGRVTLELTYKSDGDRTTGDEHSESFEEITDLIVTDSLVDDLNNAYPADDFTVHAWQEIAREETFEEPRTWISKLVLAVICSPSALVT